MLRNRISVSSADFIRNIGFWQNEALRKPISITHHGRERLVLAAPDAFETSAEDEQAVQALARLRSDVAVVLENLGDGYLSIDSQLCIRQSNAISEAFVGMSREDLDGAPVISALPQPLASIVCDRVQRVIRTRQTERFEVGAPDGRHLSLTVFPISIGAGAVMHNVTENYSLRGRMEDGEAMQQAVRVHRRAASIKLDARGRVEAVDETFTAWTGFGVGDLIGHRIIDLVASTQRREGAETIERVLREAQPRIMSITFLGKRGNEIPGELALAPILTDFVAHGAYAVFVTSVDANGAQQAA